MAEVDEKERRPRKSGPLDVWLNAGIAVLLIGLLGFAGWFGYGVWQDRKSAAMTNAPTRVIQALKAQVRKSPNDIVLRVRLGEALGAAKKYPDAVEQLNQALKIDPKHVGAYLDLGLISLLTKHEGEGERYLKKVVELTDATQYNAIDERRETALYNLGVLKLKQKKYADAAGYFKAALRIRKDASDTYVMLAEAMKGMGDTDAAIQNLEIALQFDPGFAEAHYRLGEIYRERKDDVNASYEFYAAYKKAPDAPETQEAIDSYGPPTDWIAKARKSQSSGNLELALDQILIARNLGPESAEAAKLHAAILVQRGSFSDAVDVYLQAKELAPKDAAVTKELTKLETEHPADALTGYKARLKAKPQDADLKAKVEQLTAKTK
ncbi:MAG TPA: tetratricopeptide repeat protein [Coriobacteriia bacterium]|nr:tetratricopeptide repeat protein [Coriobacteriia bacterium]